MRGYILAIGPHPALRATISRRERGTCEQAGIRVAVLKPALALDVRRSQVRNLDTCVFRCVGSYRIRPHLEIFGGRKLMFAFQSRHIAGKPSLLSMLVVTVLYFSLDTPAYSQLSSGTILGTVSDASGAVIPGVSLRVTNPG